jgi:PAS domain-containing protein
MFFLYENLAIAAGILASLGVILAARAPVWRVLRTVWRFFGTPATLTRTLDEYIAAAGALDARRDARGEHLVGQISRIELALFNGGADGLVQNMDIIKAQCRSQFESTPAPMFICDNRGGNVRVNEAYRLLVQVWRDEDIGGTQWHAVIYGDLRADYLDAWAHAAAAGEDFIADVDFCNPLTNAHRGRWKIHAPASKRAEGGVYYVGRFVAALDAEARKVALGQGWQVRLPIP